MDYKRKAEELVALMTVEEKAGLCSGASSWYLKGVPRLGLSPVMVTDGPHGLRKQNESDLGLSQKKTVPATCFPTASLTSCSFDRELLREIGQAIGEECRAEGVAVLIGPGMNIKRSPLCGRNFEYFCEDPMLSGELAAAFTEGVQSRGVGVSLKHFAMNNQETRRLIIESTADERAMREIYLSGFERAVRKASPWTVMCSYNKISGEYASENKKLLTDILRSEWGFDGLVMSDWGAVSDRVSALRAGLDLEMPGPCPVNDARLVSAAQDSADDMAALDKAARNVTRLLLRAAAAQKRGYDAGAHHALARRAAAESIVLLKNDGGLLPAKTGVNAAVIGHFALQPRYQGSGSSRINPTRLDTVGEELRKLGLRFEYSQGYPEASDSPDPALIAQAVRAARGKDIVIVFAGLPDSYESEGFDRTSLSLPESHNMLIEALAEVSDNICVVLSGGGVMQLPWYDKVKAILYIGLSGQAGAGAAADILLGNICPSGKLSETWPLRLEDNPSFGFFPGGTRTVEYRESIYVGYRYYDAADRAPRFPFGYGLSYTEFEYSDINVEDGGLFVSCLVKNTGSTAGSEIVQLYISEKDPVIFKAPQELKGFQKVRLEPGETAKVCFSLSHNDFSYYNVREGFWHVEDGEYEIRLGSSSRDIRLRHTLHIKGSPAPGPDCRRTAPGYYNIAGGVSDRDFEALLGRAVPPGDKPDDEPFSANSTLGEVLKTPYGAELLGERLSTARSDAPEFFAMFAAMMNDMPLRSAAMFAPDLLSAEKLPALINKLNAQRQAE